MVDFTQKSIAHEASDSSVEILMSDELMKSLRKPKPEPTAKPVGLPREPLRLLRTLSLRSFRRSEKRMPLESRSTVEYLSRDPAPTIDSEDDIVTPENGNVVEEEKTTVDVQNTNDHLESIEVDSMCDIVISIPNRLAGAGDEAESTSESTALITDFPKFLAQFIKQDLQAVRDLGTDIRDDYTSQIKAGVRALGQSIQDLAKEAKEEVKAEKVTDAAKEEQPVENHQNVGDANEELPVIEECCSLVESDEGVEAQLKENGDEDHKSL